MMDKVNAVVEQLRIFANRVLRVSLPVAGVLIASDVLIGTSFNVLARLSKLSGFGMQQIIVTGAILFLISKK